MARETSSSRTARGSREIDDRWIGDHYGRIHRAAWYMTGDAWEAEDLAQETFVVALDRWDRFDGRSSESTWLYGILIRLHRRRRRSFVRMRRRLLGYLDRAGELAREIDDPQVRLAQQQWRESVWAGVARLPSNQRVAIVLRFAEGMSYQEISDSIGCAVGTVKTRVHHGLKRLRQHVDCDDLGLSGPIALPSSVEPQSVIRINARW
jgi:RNA polymerase sigma-70 factor (ECF subfamily)